MPAMYSSYEKTKKFHDLRVSNGMKCLKGQWNCHPGLPKPSPYCMCGHLTFASASMGDQQSLWVLYQMKIEVPQCVNRSVQASTATSSTAATTQTIAKTEIDTSDISEPDEAGQIKHPDQLYCHTGRSDIKRVAKRLRTFGKQLSETYKALKMESQAAAQDSVNSARKLATSLRQKRSMTLLLSNVQEVGQMMQKDVEKLTERAGRYLDDITRDVGSANVGSITGDPRASSKLSPALENLEREKKHEQIIVKSPSSVVKLEQLRALHHTAAQRNACSQQPDPKLPAPQLPTKSEEVKNENIDAAGCPSLEEKVAVENDILKTTSTEAPAHKTCEKEASEVLQASQEPTSQAHVYICDATCDHTYFGGWFCRK